MRMTLADVTFDRSQPGRSIGLFLTDRCPVGCAHCSVDSRADSPTISDHVLIVELIRDLAARPHLKSVGITGGEPFIERRALTHAVNELYAAGKAIVVFTSGVWGQSAETPDWIRSTIRKLACVFLSTDTFHAASVSDAAFVRAAKSIVEEGVWLVVQVLKKDQEHAVRLIQSALGDDWGRYCEISRTVPLPFGRGASLFRYDSSWPAREFGSCSLASTPLIRYDGIVTACCNEEVIMGKGPQRLRRKCTNSNEIINAVEYFVSDPLLRGLATTGAGSLVAHGRYRHLETQSFSNICHLCWAMQEVTPGSETDSVLRANSLLAGFGGSQG